MINIGIDKLLPQMMMLLFVYMMVFVVIILDLWAGVRKAKQRNEYRSSFGYRKTVAKVARYFNMIFIVTAIDLIQMLTIYEMNKQGGYDFPLIPILTCVGAIFICFIELKSVYEKNEEKEKAQMNEAAKMAAEIIKNHSTNDVIESLLKILTENKNKEK